MMAALCSSSCFAPARRLVWVISGGRKVFCMLIPPSPPPVVQAVPVASPVLVVVVTDPCGWVSSWVLDGVDYEQQPFYNHFGTIIRYARYGSHAVWFRWLAVWAARRFPVARFPASVSIVRRMAGQPDELLFSGTIYQLSPAQRFEDCR